MKMWMTSAAILVVIVGAGITWIVIENRSIDRRLAAVRISPDLGLSQPSHDPTAGSTATGDHSTSQPLPATDEPRPAAPTSMPAESIRRATASSPIAGKRKADTTPPPPAQPPALLIPN